ncbi:MAG: hypothetical protein QM757_39120 [Paludibaculum sp.]
MSLADVGRGTGLRGVVFAEGDGAARAEGLVLQQVVVDRGGLDAEFDRVIADDFCPVFTMSIFVSVRFQGSVAV